MCVVHSQLGPTQGLTVPVVALHVQRDEMSFLHVQVGEVRQNLASITSEAMISERESTILAAGGMTDLLRR